jgi:hypothetical protein
MPLLEIYKDNEISASALQSDSGAWTPKVTLTEMTHQTNELRLTGRHRCRRCDNFRNRIGKQEIFALCHLKKSSIWLACT